MRSSSTAISWAVTCPETNTIVTSSKQETNNLQIWSIRNSSIVKLPSIDLPSTKNVKEKDVSVINVYGKSFIGINEKDEEIVKSLKLYSTENDQVILAHSLNFDGISGPLGIQTVDNLVLVHSLQGSCTHIFDIAVTGIRNQKEGKNFILIINIYLIINYIREASLKSLDGFYAILFSDLSLAMVLGYLYPFFNKEPLDLFVFPLRSLFFMNN